MAKETQISFNNHTSTAAYLYLNQSVNFPANESVQLNFGASNSGRFSFTVANGINLFGEYSNVFYIANQNIANTQFLQSWGISVYCTHQNIEPTTIRATCLFRRSSSVSSATFTLNLIKLASSPSYTLYNSAITNLSELRYMYIKNTSSSLITLGPNDLTIQVYRMI